MTTPSNSEIVYNLAEEFIGRYRRGERPAVAEYVEKFPELAEEIREVLPAMALLESVAPGDASLAGRPPVSPQSIAAPFDQFGDYRIIREVGRGGMGVVYEAEQMSLGRHVALKLLPRDARSDSRFARRFEREARAAARLHHTNIVPVFGIGEHEGMPFYVMQFIQGLGLDEVLRELQRLRDSGVWPTTGGGKGELRKPRRELSPTECARSMIEGRDQLSAIRSASGAAQGRDTTQDAINSSPDDAQEPKREIPADDATLANGALSDTSPASDLAAVLPGHSESLSGTRRRIPAYWRSIGHIGIQVAHALEYAHDQGILHRDVKPSNLLLDTRGTVWVADFGLAKTNDQQDLTHSGDVLGTLRYMSPEAFNGKTDPRSDVYSLGATLYELAALRPAYNEKDRPQLVKQIATTDPPRLDKLNSDVPRDLATVIQKALDRDPEHRYQTAGELAADLQRFLDDEPIRARRPALHERIWRLARRNRGLAAALSAILVLLMIGAASALVVATRFHGVASAMSDLATQRESDRRQAVAARDDALVARRNEQQLRERESELRRQAEAAQALANERAETVRQNLYFAQMSMAGHAWKGMNGAARMQDLLLKWRPGPEAGPESPRDLRGWEWYYLASRYFQSQLTIRDGVGPIEAAAYSPDGTRFAIAARFRGVEIRDAETGRLLVPLYGHAHQVRAVAWSPDGTILATAGDDQVVFLWDVSSAHRLAVMYGHEGPIVAVDFSPDGKQLLSASRDQTIRLWDAVEHRETAVLRGHGAEVHAARWSPNGTQIVSASPDGAIRLWDAQSNTEIRNWTDQVWRLSVSWSPDGRYIASTSSDDLTCKLWDVQTGQEVRRFRGHSGEVVSVAFDVSGRRLVSSSIDGAALVWDVETGTLLSAFRGHIGTAICACWSPDGTHLLTAGQDGVMRTWDVARNQEFKDLRGHTAYPKSLAWSPDGRQLISGGNDQTLRLWDVAAAREIVAHPSEGSEIVAVCWHPQQPWIAAGMGDGTIRIREEPSGRLLSQITAHQDRINSVAWSRDGARLATGSNDGTAKIWDPGPLHETGEASRELATLHGHTGGVTGLAFSPGDKSLATCSVDATIRIWETGTWTETALLKGHGGIVNAVSWNPDGRRLASCSWDNTGRIWDVASQKETMTLAGHSANLYTIAWSPDGTRIATGGMDREVKLWDAAAGAEVISFGTHPNQVISAVWSPDGMQLATASFDRTLHVFDAAPASEVYGIGEYLDALGRRLASDPDNARAHALRSRTLTRLRQFDDARRANDEAARIYERRLADHPTGSRYAAEFSRFLLDRALAAVEWKAVAPTAMHSTGDVTLTARPDKSILAAGPHVANIVYEISLPAPPEPVTGMRLEVLTDPSFPNNGPGRDVLGNFVLTHLSVLHATTADADPGAELVLCAARADFMQHGFRLARAIEKSSNYEFGWAVNPAVGRPHEALFEFEKPVELSNGGHLIVRLGHKHPTLLESTVGCFRLSLTNSPNPVRLTRLRDDLARSNAGGWPRLAAVAALTGDHAVAAVALEKCTAEEATHTGEELFLMALAAAWLEQPAAAETYLARGLEWDANSALDATRNELARDALAAVRHLTDTPAGELLKHH
jgi:WD40 repeat protein/serine/threonine protein kinase